MKKKFTKSVIAFAMALSLMATGSATTVYAVTGESLNNQDDGSGDALTLVTDSSSTGSFTVNLTSDKDGIKVYKVAVFDWTTHTVQWTPTVQSWVNGNSTYKQYSTPALLASATETVQSEFFKALNNAGLTFTEADESTTVAQEEVWDSQTNSTGADTLVAGYDGDVLSRNVRDAVYEYYDANGDLIDSIGEGKTYSSISAWQAKSGGVTVGDTTNVTTYTAVLKDDGVDSFTISNVPLGMYMVIGYNQSSSKTYNPTTATIVPTQYPNGKWYISNDVEYSFKASDVWLHKQINKDDTKEGLEQTDIVNIGETVDFDIDFLVPIYEARTLNGTNGYTLTLNDTLADCFTMDMDSVKVQYSTDSGDTYNDIPSEYYASLIATPAPDTQTNGITIFGCSPSHMVTYDFRIIRNRYTHNTYKYTKSGATAAQLETYRNTMTSTYGTKDTDWFEDDYGMYIKETWYAYFYYKNGAYVALKNDTEGQSYPQYYGASSTVTCPVTPSATDLTGTQVRAIYSAATKDTINHGFYLYTADGTYKNANMNTKVCDITFSSSSTTISNESQKTFIMSLFKNVFNITFDVQKLLGTTYYNSSNIQYKVSYKAEVNQKIEINSENNTNTAELIYELSPTKTNSITSTVNAYTYGLNLLKIDGDTVDSETPTYLEGAKFYLYKEVDAFVEPSASVTNDTMDPTLSIYQGSMFDTRRTDDYRDDDITLTAGTTTLAAYQTAYPAADGSYYYYTYKADAAGTLDDVVSDSSSAAKVTYQAGDYITRVFKIVTLYDSVYKSNYDFEGTITSVKTADGYNVRGLDEGNYIVQEYLAPSGYNTLAEDLMFSLYKIDEDTANTTTYNGSYKLYADSVTTSEGTTTSTVTTTDGIYKLSVLNYKGLTLPSTGGMGTLLFILLGVILMTMAVIMAVKKNRKLAKATAGMLAMLLAAGMMIGSASSVYAVNEVTLDNSYGTIVSGDNQKVTFTVQLKNAGDTIEVYQLAELAWDSTNNTYSSPAWVTGIKNKIDADATYKAYSDPETLGTATTEEQIEFLQWLYDNKATNNLNSYQLGTTQVYYTDSTKASYTVKDVPFGIYMVRATGNGKTYSLLTVNAMPTQEGPSGNWYLQDNITATLKFSNLVMEKTIDDTDGVAVKTDETVHFDIYGETPDYPGVEDENGDLKYTSYWFAMNDTMDDAFDFDSITGVTVIGTTEAGHDFETLDDSANSHAATKYTTSLSGMYQMLFADAYDSTSKLGVMSYKDSDGNAYLYCNVTANATSGYYDLAWYAFNTVKGTCVYLNADTKKVTSLPATINSSTISNFTAVQTAYKAAISPKTACTSFSQDSAQTVMNVTFDYDKLRTAGIKSVKITYKATVTPTAEIGNDSNTNTASFYYQKNLAGDTGIDSDTVYAWTYGITVKKVDGNSNTPLEGAIFKLYKEAFEYVPTTYAESSTAPGTASTDYANYVFASAKYGATEQTGTLDDLDQLESGDYADCYYRYVSYTADDTDCGCSWAGKAAHSHVIVYAKMTYKTSDGTEKDTITSTTDAAGVTVTGLEPASYVLIETTAPANYNKLTEALRLEIYEMTDAQATAYGNETADGVASLKAFYSDETYTDEEIAADSTLKYITIDNVNYKVYDSGSYELTVKNYKGLTLPSTGGMGTLLFTILGILVMMIALVVVVNKKRKMEY